MNKTQEALKMLDDWLDDYTPDEVRKALQEALVEAEKQEPKCSEHPDAPHGFCRDASHSADRYVCECEFWEEPKEQEPVAWKGLTDVERQNIIKELSGYDNDANNNDVALWIEKALKELNAKK